MEYAREAETDEEMNDICASLFNVRSAAEEKFYFKEISINDQTVVFKYSYCNELHFESVLLLDRAVPSDKMCIRRTLFSIGMCICSWYWMGYFTPDIVISEDIVRLCCINVDMMGFWQTLYHNITLEFVYLNRLPYQRVNFVLAGGPATATDSKPTDELECVYDRSAHSIIIPMGGLFLFLSDIETSFPYLLYNVTFYCAATRWQGQSSSVA